MAQMSRLVWWLAWAPTLVVLLAAGPMVYFATANGETSLGDNVLSAWLILVFALMGSLIASRRPRNAVGWFLCLVALLAITGDLSIEYAVYGLARHPGALPGADWAALYGGISRSLGWFYMITLIPLYFPTGKLPSPRWRWIAWALLVTTAALLVSGAFGQTFTNSDNRLVGMRSPMPLLPDTIANGVFSLAALVMFGLMLCSVYAVAVRFLRARGTDRQQLKWFVYAVAITAILGSFFGSVMFLSLKISLVGSIWYLATVGMPIAAGIAILRYRLYDIDIIINRTLVYGSLTAILAALYFGLVIGAQTLTRLLTGKQAQQQPIVIVLSTLLIAALVQPLRGWLQRWIDRRFYRSRYDAAKTVAAFSASLRSEVDLRQLNEQLLAVVEKAMRPAQVSLWLREAPHSRQAPPAERAAR